MKVFLIAGEASGDDLGGALMRGLRDIDPSVVFSGVGGPEMESLSLQSRFPMEELSVMGLAEVLPKYRALKARIRECADAIIANSPDVLVTIDSPDFCLRVARLVKRALPSLRTVHYVAPSVWAWRPGRADKMAKVIDQVLCLLPFEPPYMEAAGMRADFVGHPVVAEPQASDGDASAFRRRHDIASDAPLFLVLPGSRKGEVARLAGEFGDALSRVAKELPAMRVVVPTTRGVGYMLPKFVRHWPGEPIILDPRATEPKKFASDKRAAFRAANVALAASGTVSLELAAAGTSMLIAYDMNWFSRAVISWMLKIDTVTLVNLVSETRSVPEFLGNDCRAELIAPALRDLLDAPATQNQAIEITMQRLGKGQEAPGLRAARAILDGLGQQVG